MAARLVVIFWYMTIAAAAAETFSAGQGVAAEVQYADNAFNRALERSDVALLRELIADAYIFTDPRGRVSHKQELIDGFAGGRIRIKSQTTQDVRIEVYSDTAVETGLLTSVAVRDGRNSSGSFRFTRIWVRMGRRWQTVGFQETALQTVSPATR